MPTSVRIFAALSVLLLGVIAGVSSAPGSAAALMAEPEPDLQVIMPSSDIHQHEVFQLVVAVSNPGAVAFQEVMVVGAYSDRLSSSFSGPAETVGNNDEFLDPGEEWRFEATCRASMGIVGVTVSALDMLGNLVAVTSLPIEFEPLSALLVEVAPSATRVPIGGEVMWTVTVTNLSTTLLNGVGAEGRLLYTEWTGPIPNIPLTPVERGNGDDVLDPGEVWSFALTTTLFDDRFLEVGIIAKPHETEAAWFGQTEHSALVSVVEPSTPDTTQPETLIPNAEDIAYPDAPEAVDAAPSMLPYTGLPVALAVVLSFVGMATGFGVVRAARVLKNRGR